MRALFPDHPEVVGETQRVANLCEFDFEKRYFLPQFPRPAEFASDNDLLVHLARVGGRRGTETPSPRRSTSGSTTSSESSRTPATPATS